MQFILLLDYKCFSFEPVKKAKLLFIFIFLYFISFALFAQNRNYLKAQKSYETKKYETALKQINKARKDKSLNKDPESYMLESKIWLGIYEKNHTEISSKNAVKLAIKAQEKSESSGFIDKHKNHFIAISKLNNAEAMSNFNEGRYSKSIPLFKRSIALNNDSFMEFMLAKSYLKNNDPKTGMPLIEKLLINQFQHFSYNQSFATFSREGFNIYTQYLFENSYMDSTELFLSMGLSMFPNDKEMLIIQKQIWYKQINDFPLSDDLFYFLEQATDIYPFDSLFTFKKNGVYLVFINNHIKAKNIMLADSWFNKFANEKIKLAKLSPTKKQKQEDYFLELDKKIILKKLIFYFGNYNQIQAQNYFFEHYVTNYFKTGGYDIAIDSLKNIFPANIVANIYQYTIDKTKNLALIKARQAWYKSLLLEPNKRASTFEALLNLNENIASIDIKNTEKKLILSQYWQQQINENNFAKAYQLGKQFDKAFPNQEIADSFWKLTMKKDFDISYYNTRVLMKTSENLPYGFTWNGNVSSCYPGYLPDSILGNVAERLNYFRRMAGLENPIVLAGNLNSACQKAALFYSANKNLTHDLNQNLTCYTQEGADAAKYGLLTQGVHTTISITEFMNDNSNSVGNRRWFLYPPTQYMGFGCTDFNSVLWCAEEKKQWDTNFYKSNFVAWPPIGYIPKIFAFKNWSFSGFYDFDKATVKMTNVLDNKDIPCSVLTNINGYGMPTLVWQPTINYRNIMGDETIKVFIKLKNGKTFSYTTKLIDYKK